MKESIEIAWQVYLTGFAISMVIAALIKGMLLVISRFSSNKDTDNN